MATKKPKGFAMIVGAELINKEIASIRKSVGTLENKIHVAAVSCLAHAGEHGDVTLMRNLVAALGKSQRKNALLDWAQAFGKFVYNETTKELDYCKTNNTDIDGAIASPFWEFKPEQAYQQFDMAAALAALLKKAEKAAQSDKQAVPVPEQALTELRRLAATVAPTAAKA
jgi:hypothetical protein